MVEIRYDRYFEKHFFLPLLHLSELNENLIRLKKCVAFVDKYLDLFGIGGIKWVVEKTKRIVK